MTPGARLGQGLGDVLLMGRVGVGVEEADGDGVGPTVNDGLNGPVDGSRVEGAQDFAAEVEALANLEAVLALD